MARIENSPKSGLHSRQEATVPVPFLSFESLRGRPDADTSMSAGPSGAQYGVAGSGSSLVDSMVLEKLVEDSGAFFKTRFSCRSLI